MALLVLRSALLRQDKTKKWMDYRLGIAALMIGFMVVYLTYTRGALLGFLCGLPFVLYYYRAKLGLTHYKYEIYTSSIYRLELTIN